MNKEVAKKWVAALRSGEFKQGAGTLQDRNKFCCLGVLCRLAVDEGVLTLRGEGLVGGSLSMYPEVEKWSGVKGFGYIDPNKRAFVDGLAHLNDAGATFEQIADIIESNAETLS